MVAIEGQYLVLLLSTLVSRSLSLLHERDGHQHNTLIGNVSTTQRSPSEDCNTCIIEAPGGVSLIYWAPEDANVSSAGNEISDPQAVSQYTHVENGFTFTSPSVYVVYTSLQATYGCNGGPVQTFGSAYERKTIGYSSRFLAYGTLSSPDQRCDENVVVGGFHTIDFTDLYYHPITTSVTTKAGCPPYVNPRLSMPAELTDIDTAWKTCQPLFYGAFDPPRVLTSVKGGLSPLLTPGSPEPNAASTSHPAVTTSQEIAPIPVTAIQGSHAPTIPTPTSDITPSTPADKEDPKENGDAPQGLASHIAFGFLGPKTSDVGTNPHDNGNTDGSAPTVGNSPASSPLSTASLTISTPLAASAHSASQTQQAIVVPDPGIASEPQVENEGISGFAGTSKLAFGRTTNTKLHQSESPIKTTLYMSTTKVHTLAVDAATTVDGSPTTNTGSSAVTWSKLTSIAIATAVATKSPPEDSQGDADPAVYSIDIETNTIEPHETFTKHDDIFINTAPTAVTVMQTSSIPLAYSSLGGSRKGKDRIIYSINVKTNTLQPNEATTNNGRIFTNTASTAIAVTQTSSIPLAHPSLKDSRQDVGRVIYSTDIVTYTLQPSQAVTNDGKTYSNTALTAIVITQTSSIPLVMIEDSQQDVDRVVYSVDVVTDTLQPNQVATNNGEVFTNSASTAMAVTQTSSVPLVTIDRPRLKVFSTLYEASPVTSTISPGAIFTISGSRTTNTATSAMILTDVIQVPISTATHFPANTQNLGLIPNVNSQPATPSMGIEDHSETYTATEVQDELVTLVYVDGRNQSTVSKVMTNHHNPISQSTTRIPSSHSEDTTVADLSITTKSAEESPSTAAPDASAQSQVLDDTNGAGSAIANSGLVVFLVSIAGCIWILV